MTGLVWSLALSSQLQGTLAGSIQHVISPVLHDQASIPNPRSPRLPLTLQKPHLLRLPHQPTRLPPRPLPPLPHSLPPPRRHPPHPNLLLLSIHLHPRKPQQILLSFVNTPIRGLPLPQPHAREIQDFRERRSLALRKLQTPEHEFLEAAAVTERVVFVVLEAELGLLCAGHAARDPGFHHVEHCEADVEDFRSDVDRLVAVVWEVFEVVFLVRVSWGSLRTKNRGRVS